jgi:hypothetical protein
MGRREIETYAPREELSAAHKWPLRNSTIDRLMRIPHAGAMKFGAKENESQLARLENPRRSF